MDTDTVALRDNAADAGNQMPTSVDISCKPPESFMFGKSQSGYATGHGTLMTVPDAGSGPEARKGTGKQRGHPHARISVLRLRTGVLGSSPPRRFLTSPHVVVKHGSTKRTAAGMAASGLPCATSLGVAGVVQHSHKVEIECYRSET
jgi:hypothetical protein